MLELLLLSLTNVINLPEYVDYRHRHLGKSSKVRLVWETFLIFLLPTYNEIFPFRNRNSDSVFALNSTQLVLTCSQLFPPSRLYGRHENNITLTFFFFFTFYILKRIEIKTRMHFPIFDFWVKCNYLFNFFILTTNL